MAVSRTEGSQQRRTDFIDTSRHENKIAESHVGILGTVLHAIYENTIGLVAHMLGFRNPIEHKSISERTIEKLTEKPVKHPSGFEITDDAFHTGVIKFQEGYNSVEQTGDIDRMVGYIIQETRSEDPVQRMVALTFLTRLYQYAADNTISTDPKISADCARILNNGQILPAIRARSSDENPTISGHSKQYLQDFAQLSAQKAKDLDYAFHQALDSENHEVVIGFLRFTNTHNDPVQRTLGFQKMIELLKLARENYAWLDLFESAEISRLIGQGRGDNNPKVKILANAVYKELTTIQAKERFDAEFNNIIRIQDPALTINFLVGATRDGDPERRLLAMDKINELLKMAKEHAADNPDLANLFQNPTLRAALKDRISDAHSEVQKHANDILRQLS
jgi:hypothetical protein